MTKKKTAKRGRPKKAGATKTPKKRGRPSKLDKLKKKTRAPRKKKAGPDEITRTFDNNNEI